MPDYSYEKGAVSKGFKYDDILNIIKKGEE